MVQQDILIKLGINMFYVESQNLVIKEPKETETFPVDLIQGFLRSNAHSHHAGGKIGIFQNYFFFKKCSHNSPMYSVGENICSAQCSLSKHVSSLSLHVCLQMFHYSPRKYHRCLQWMLNIGSLVYLLDLGLDLKKTLWLNRHLDAVSQFSSLALPGSIQNVEIVDSTE